MSTFQAAALRPVDGLEVLVLIDNVTDSLSTVPSDVVNENAKLMKAGLTRMSGEAKCCWSAADSST
jgi:7,8-dihydropterin-6-yl-methyl-4-(beta-D-ribofuranosyl)aminobenzene 5'-phosphate synthase